MTVTAQYPNIEYAGDGIQLIFSFDFRLISETDLKVFVDTVQQVLFSEYTIQNLTEDGGDVVFAVAPAGGTKIQLIRVTAKTQQVDYEPFTPFPAHVTEFTIDKLTMIVQELEQRFIDDVNPQVFSIFGRVGDVLADCSDYAFCYTSLADWNAHINNVNAHHSEVHAHDGADGSGPVSHTVLTDVSPTDSNPHGNVRWLGIWIQQQYNPNEQVIDQDWLMLANTTTTDRAAPQPTGSPEWILPTAPTWDPQAYTGVVYTGLRILPDAGRLIAVTEVRVWLPDVTADAHYRVVLIDLITGAVAAGSPFLGNVLVSPGWYPVNAPSEFIQGGDDVAVVLESYNSAATTDFNYPWRYTGSTQAGGDPGTGNINHDNQQNLLRINDTDNDAVDRTAQLASVVPGTIIRVAEEGNPTAYLEYQVLVSNGFATWYEYAVTLLDTGSSGPLPATRCTVSFQVPVAALTDYVRIVGQYIGDPVLFGYLAFDTISGGTFNDVAYGVDVQYQEYVASPDWDYQAFTGTAGGSASARNNRSITQSRTWFDRWLPTELDRLADGIQGAKWQPGPPPSNATVLRLNLFVGYISAPIVNLGRSRLWLDLEWLESIGILDPGRAAILIEP